MKQRLDRSSGKYKSKQVTQTFEEIPGMDLEAQSVFVATWDHSYNMFNYSNSQGKIYDDIVGTTSSFRCVYSDKTLFDDWFDWSNEADTFLSGQARYTFWPTIMVLFDLWLTWQKNSSSSLSFHFCGRLVN